ncbi:MAG: GNAT family N-acetyltransferase [Solirubrobacteraceae bacterium]
MWTAGAGARSLVVESLGDARGLRARWQELASGSHNVFSTWEWASVWWRHFGSGRMLEVSSVLDAGGRTIALLPLTRERRGPFRIVRFAGNRVADELGPVCAPADRVAATASLRDAADGADVLIAERVRSDWPPRLLGGRILSEDDSPVISLAAEGDWEAYLRARSANFRQQVRRRERKLQRSLDVRFRLANDPARLDADVDALVALHRARWGAQSSSFDGARESFHREFASVALERGWLWLWLAESDGVPVAAWYGFRFAGVESYYQSGRDPQWDRHGVGAGILEHSIREAFADGMHEYRLLRGDESYKRRYATAPGTVVTVALPGTARGRALVAGVERIAVRPRGRRLVSRFAA